MPKTRRRCGAKLKPFFVHRTVPARFQSPATRNTDSALSGLIAPHIDPRRGGPAYAHAYGQLMTRERPELVVILGTSHFGGGPQLFTATRKDYMTPFGPVATDREFAERLARRYTQGDLFAEELLHRNEHSIEFQVLFLAWTLGNAGYQVLPILVGSFHQMVTGGLQPSEDPRVSGFLEALKAELAADDRRALIIAGVDFAHVGKKFGDSFSADTKIAEWVRTEDLALIETIKAGDPEAFFARVAAEHDARKICGLAPMYVQLEVLKGRPGRLLAHDIAMEPQTESAVSFASIAID
jgi:AmmeMemoRadiSam system protein B